ncbi:hypothetical protein MHUMG1_08917 [Metarhizium humberi]|uniref:Major facilitator superfamily (MFS) profile domain-containing protein n=1 Tax=Metarhizium humberi TaxID=2596975 RepID=A0A9P8M3R4_9HYPO|nr:hypothetical protein MHUMG1_08917 [Metarhizium humberi]
MAQSRRSVLEAGHLHKDDAADESSSLLRRDHGAVQGTSPITSEAECIASRSTGDPSPEQFYFIFSQILVTAFISSFDMTIMASSHPVITAYFGAANAASLLSTAFLITSTVSHPLVGGISDATGRKIPFVASLALFAIATLWCSLAESIESLIAARAICGIGAGGSVTLGKIIISDLVPVERRGIYQSYLSIVFGIGCALGAALGGTMAESLGWRWEFAVQIPPMLLCVGMAALTIPGDLGISGESQTVVETIREFDTTGSFLLTLAVSFLILGLNLGGNMMPWSHPFVIASFAIFAISSPVFILVESRVPRPIMPPSLIFSMPRSNLVFSQFMSAVLSNAILFNMPLYFQAVLLTSATVSGLRLVIPTAITSIAGALTGFVITRTGHLKPSLIWGMMSCLCGTICLALMQRDLPDTLYLLALVPHAIGAGMQFPGSFIAILAVSEQAEQAVVTSTLALWRSLGMVFGIAGSSLVVQNALVHYLAAFVRGEKKEEVIACARASVAAVATLDQPYREQVVRSYEAALSLTFEVCIAVAVVSLLLIVPINLPLLPSRK